jgi:hypothetical protein
MPTPTPDQIALMHPPRHEGEAVLFIAAVACFALGCAVFVVSDWIARRRARGAWHG